MREGEGGSEGGGEREGGREGGKRGGSEEIIKKNDDNEEEKDRGMR